MHLAQEGSEKTHSDIAKREHEQTDLLSGMWHSFQSDTGVSRRTISPHGSWRGSLLLTILICFPFTDTVLSSMTLHIDQTLQATALAQGSHTLYLLLLFVLIYAGSRMHWMRHAVCKVLEGKLVRIKQSQVSDDEGSQQCSAEELT